jgi:hypothetical protein
MSPLSRPGRSVEFRVVAEGQVSGLRNGGLAGRQSLVDDVYSPRETEVCRCVTATQRPPGVQLGGISVVWGLGAR